MNLGRTVGGWVREAKRGLGYYRLRASLFAPRFDRALRPTDVFLVGHPKSGNTWLAYMLAVLAAQDDGDDITLANVGRFVPFVHGRDHRIEGYEHLPDPRVFRNEYPLYADRYPKTIYLVRDPRAVLPSLWEMYRTMRGDRTLGFERFLEQYLQRRGVFRHWNSELVRWDRQVDAALRRADGDPRFQVVRYESMVADRRAVLVSLAALLGLEPPETRIDQAVERGSFEAMRDLEDRHGAEAYLGRAEGSGRFVRKGATDGWRDELSVAAIARIEAELGWAMRRAGYLA